MADLTIKTILAKSTLFGELDEEQIALIVGLAGLFFFSKGQLIFSEEDEVAAFLIIASGQVKIVKYSGEGKEQILHMIGPNEPVGEVAAFLGGKYPATCVALSNVEVISIKRSDFIRLIEAQPQLALNLLAILAQRLHLFSALVGNLSLAEAPEKLAKFLLNMLVDPQESLCLTEFSLPVSKTELAKMLGMTSETLSRTFALFKNNGLIELKGRQVKVLNRDRLQTLYLN